MGNVTIIKTAEEMQAKSRELLRAGKRIGFVPTMGALHTGHMKLVERARKENDTVIVSIYVNPTQFGEGEDYEKYPRPFDADQKLCAEAGVDIIFAPETLYAEDARTFIHVGELDEPMCGMSRPGHFRGVATVVTKLLSIVRPDKAYFGRKDAQQLLIVETLVRDLNLGCEIVPCETVRESDGLAMSSRNRYLSPSERKQAPAIHKALEYCRLKISQGERDAMKLIGEMAEILEQQPDLEIDYVVLVNAKTLGDLTRLRGDVLAAIAAKVGTTRLIDNERIEGIQ
ncbi:MAG TPA: pantoate--beta-alanine ligase [Planctomycetota bacterium]|nr:pantoate--beta-alanine ligase [Planctomycetota bacterium]